MLIILVKIYKVLLIYFIIVFDIGTKLAQRGYQEMSCPNEATYLVCSGTFLNWWIEVENYYKVSISYSKFDEVNSMQTISIGLEDAVFTVNSNNGSFISVL